MSAGYGRTRERGARTRRQPRETAAEPQCEPPKEHFDLDRPSVRIWNLNAPALAAKHGRPAPRLACDSRPAIPTCRCDNLARRCSDGERRGMLRSQQVSKFKCTGRHCFVGAQRAHGGQAESMPSSYAPDRIVYRGF
jgi:hypothetical protein